jgi:sugar phosphate isomerase/epimerase
MNRRTFLVTSGWAIFTASRYSWAETDHIDPVGLQLYTVRDALKRDFDGTLAEVAKTGYREVEFAGYFDHTPQQVHDALARHQLSAPSGHVEFKTIDDKWKAAVDACAAIGHRYLVNPWIDESQRKNADGWKQTAETFNKAGEYCKKSGVQFAYHNHNFEFDPVGDKLGYDILLDNTDPALVQMELDLCWITVAGRDPLKYFASYPGRFPLVHVKDVRHVPNVKDAGSRRMLDRVSHDEMTSVGAGSIDWKNLFSHSRQAGIQHYFVEHDLPKDAFASIRSSYAYLHTLRF